MEFRKLFRIIFVAMVVAGLVLASGALAAPPAAGGDDNEVISETVDLAQTSTPTKRQMRKAKPMDMPEASGGPVFAEEAAQPSIPLEVIAGGAPGVRSAGSVDLLGEGEVEPTFLPKNKAYNYPPPYTRYKMPNAWYKTYPHSTVGKLYFQKPTGTSWYVCSGAVAVGRAVWTAGHCVYTPGSGWNRNHVFYPAYKNGADAVYGGWTAFTKSTLYGWTQNKLPYDIGMLAVSDKQRMKISQVTGYLCAAWGGSSLRQWHDFGYPQASPFNGKYQYVCAASRAWQDARQGKPWTNGIGCDMTGGCSGGPWLWRYAPNSTGAVNCVNSVNSYRYTSPNQKYAIHGPYFGTGAKNLYNWGKTK